MAEGKKRREPKEVSPVEVDGLRYEAPLAGAPYGYAQDGGILTARDTTTCALVWSQRVYIAKHDSPVAHDKQDLFITSLQLSQDGHSLLIENEHGERFSVNLMNRSMELLGVVT